MSQDLESIAATLVADGKGILAADESVATLTRRFEKLGIPSTEPSRRAYREMLFTTTDAAEFISGAILYDETIRQKSSGGTPLAEVLQSHGIVPGIKVDTGAEPLAGFPEERVTEGLDGLRDRLEEYHGMGARFAKWRAVIRITDTLPSRACVSANAHALARYAALCQEQQLVPIAGNPPAEAAYACGVRRARIAHATGLTTGCETSSWVRRCHGSRSFEGRRAGAGRTRRNVGWSRRRWWWARPCTRSPSAMA
jgi:fructose-bisphosphate aldolase class 1